MTTIPINGQGQPEDGSSTFGTLAEWATVKGVVLGVIDTFAGAFDPPNVPVTPEEIDEFVRNAGNDVYVCIRDGVVAAAILTFKCRVEDWQDFVTTFPNYRHLSGDNGTYPLPTVARPNCLACLMIAAKPDAKGAGSAVRRYALSVQPPEIVKALTVTPVDIIVNPQNPDSYVPTPAMRFHISGDARVVGWMPFYKMPRIGAEARGGLGPHTAFIQYSRGASRSWPDGLDKAA